MLTRIYGTAFFTEKDLEAHLEQIEQAKERDHRRLGPQLGLFTFRPEAPGMPFWQPNGTVLLRTIEAEVHEQLRKRGYGEIKTPQVLDEELWHRSGHYDNYRENMFFTEPAERERANERRFALRPMNCPGACLAYDSGAALLPRPAAAPGGVRPGLPLRARGRPARPAQGPLVHPGRRPRLLHDRADAPTR